jgi:hypothetical protein
MCVALKALMSMSPSGPSEGRQWVINRNTWHIKVFVPRWHSRSGPSNTCSKSKFNLSLYPMSSSMGMTHSPRMGYLFSLLRGETVFALHCQVVVPAHHHQHNRELLCVCWRLTLFKIKYLFYFCFQTCKYFPDRELIRLNSLHSLWQ